MNIFSIDVEDYYHVLDETDIVPIDTWDNCPNYVEKNLLKIFDILDKNNTKATCFFLGYIARRYPHLVKMAANRGHEIACHGMNHQLIFHLKRSEFLKDISDSKKLIEDISGVEVLGYRAPCFSLKENNKTFYEDLASTGYKYDSSLFPAAHDFGGNVSNQYKPFKIETSKGNIIEFPISTAQIFNKRTCFFGGGYLRFFPYFLIKLMSNQVIKENRPVIYYIHPREIDPNHPRIKMTKKRYFKSYVNLKTVEKKINNILSDFKCNTFKQYIVEKGLFNE